MCQRRPAERRCNIPSLKHQASRSLPIEIRGLDIRMSQEPVVAPCPIVAMDQDNVGFIRRKRLVAQFSRGLRLAMSCAKVAENSLGRQQKLENCPVATNDTNSQAYERNTRTRVCKRNTSFHRVSRSKIQDLNTQTGERQTTQDSTLRSHESIGIRNEF